MRLPRFLPAAGVALVLSTGVGVLPALAEDDDEPAVATRSSASVTQSLQGEQGLSVQTMCTNCNEADLELGGLGDEHIDVEIDGWRLCGGLPRIFALSILPASVVSKTDVSSGPGYAERSYEAIGGSLAMRTRPPSFRPAVRVSQEAGSFGWDKTALAADGRLGPVTARVSGTRSHFDVIDANEDGFSETGEIDQWTAMAEAGVDMRRFGRLRLGAARIRDDQVDGHGQVERDPATGQPIGWLKEDTFVDYDETRAGYDLDLPGGHRVRVRATRFQRDQTIRSPFTFSFEEKVDRYVIQEENTIGDVEWDAPLGTRWLVSAGWSGEDDRNEVTGELPASLPRLEESVKGWGAFAQARIDLDPELTLTVGARYDRFEIRSNAVLDVFDPVSMTTEPAPQLRRAREWSPRASLLWKPVSSLTLRGSFGYGLRPPRPIFNEICCGQQPEPNTLVEFERSRNAALDVTWQPTTEWKLGAYVNRNDFEDYIIKMVGGSADLKQKLMQGNVTDATFEGLSLSASWRGRNGVIAQGSFGWVDARNDGDTITLYPTLFQPFALAFPVTLPLEEVPYVARKRGQLALRYEPQPGPFAIGITAQYTGSMLIQQYDDVAGTVGVFPPGGLREDYRTTPDFWVFSVSGSADLHDNVELFFGIDNLFDEIQTDLDDFSTDYNWGVLRGRYVYGGLAFRY